MKRLSKVLILGLFMLITYYRCEKLYCFNTEDCLVKFKRFLFFQNQIIAISPNEVFSCSDHQMPGWGVFLEGEETEPREGEIEFIAKISKTDTEKNFIKKVLIQKIFEKQMQKLKFQHQEIKNEINFEILNNEKIIDTTSPKIV